MKLMKEGTVLLAIKADQLPRSTATLRDLEDWIGSDVPATQALRQLVNDHRVVVLIDQLDALSELMDQHSERLGALIRFINSIRGFQRLHVIVSCREFEFRNDVRLNTLNAKEVSLRPLSWEQVKPVLSARGFDFSGWNKDVRNVLRTPQHLAMFLAHVATSDHTPNFTNYQDLLARIIETRVVQVYGARTVKAAEIIATAMATEEELWLGRDRFKLEFHDHLDRLEEAGFLIRSEKGQSIAFRHQTLFDFLRARAFLRNRQSLAEFVVDQKQQSLFVRPILWSTLNYLRASDRAGYREQLHALLTRQDLRPHILRLIISFLGQLRDPEDQEARWLLPQLDEDTLRPSVLQAIAGSPGWFARLKSRLPQFMTDKPEKASEVSTVLRSASSFEPDPVLRAIDRYWVPEERYLPYAQIVMLDFSSWDESSVETVCKLADHAPANTFWIQRIAGRISKCRPDLAPMVVSRYLNARIECLDSSRSPNDRQPASETLDAALTEPMPRAQVEIRPYEGLIDSIDWDGIDKVARRAPRTFIEEIWPWLKQLFSRLAQKEHPFLFRYRHHHGRGFERESRDKPPFQSAIQIALRGFAESHAEDYLAFVEKNKNTDLRVLHRLLSLGMKEIAPHHPSAVLHYLLEDPRRFDLGDICNVFGDTQELISALVPSLDKDQALRLELAIRQWTWYRRAPENENDAGRLERLKWVRGHRLRLLRVFPFDRLSTTGQQHIGEGEKALPDGRAEEVMWSGVESPMSTEQMEKAADDDILGLFDELTDDTNSHHPNPNRLWAGVGGSVQASHEFARFAKKMPDRALRLIPRFQAGKTERPVGDALPELANSSIPVENLIACIHDLADRGFSSDEFKTGAARCLHTVANKSNGLHEKTCALLEKWINNWSPEGDEDLATNEFFSSNDLTDRNKSQEEDPISFLWDDRGGHSIPQGNYPILYALMWGYVLRDPPDLDQWLALLERHLERNENPEVWREVARDLWRLRRADRARANRFFESFFSLHPEILRTATGVSLIACVQPWLPASLIERVTEDWISNGWQDGPQAAGELIALWLWRNPDDPNARTRVERILSGKDFDRAVIDGLRLGLTYTFMAAWSKPALRALTTPLLIRLALTASSAIESAMRRIFQKVDPLPADDHTLDLLETFLKRPSILAKGDFFILKGLKGLLRAGWNPKVVYRVANTLISNSVKDLEDIRTGTVFHTGDLADISLTLHRIPETKEHGLELFERLMDASSYELNKRIKAIDRLAIR